MTVPRERTLAVLWARKLLKDVARCKDAPEHLRADAKHILRHFPLAYEVHWAAQAAPDLFEVDKENLVTLRALREAGNDDLY
jgi:hypothetical protein